MNKRGSKQATNGADFVYAQRDDLARNDSTFWSATVDAQNDSTQPMFSTLGCKEVSTGEKYSKLVRWGNGKDSERVYFQFSPHSTSAIRANNGAAYVVPLEDKWEGPDGTMIAIIEASHLCHNPFCSARGHVIFETQRQNYWRQYCAVFPHMPCPCESTSRGKCIKPEVAMSAEDISQMATDLEAEVDALLL